VKIFVIINISSKSFRKPSSVSLLVECMLKIGHFYGVLNQPPSIKKEAIYRLCPVTVHTRLSEWDGMEKDGQSSLPGVSH